MKDNRSYVQKGPYCSRIEHLLAGTDNLGQQIPIHQQMF